MPKNTYENRSGRRDFVKMVATLGASALLAACGQSETNAPYLFTPTPEPQRTFDKIFMGYHSGGQGWNLINYDRKHPGSNESVHTFLYRVQSISRRSDIETFFPSGGNTLQLLNHFGSLKLLGLPGGCLFILPFLGASEIRTGNDLEIDALGSFTQQLLSRLSANPKNMVISTGPYELPQIGYNLHAATDPKQISYNKGSDKLTDRVDQIISAEASKFPQSVYHTSIINLIDPNKHIDNRAFTSPDGKVTDFDYVHLNTVGYDLVWDAMMQSMIKANISLMKPVTVER